MNKPKLHLAGCLNSVKAIRRNKSELDKWVDGIRQQHDEKTATELRCVVLQWVRETPKSLREVLDMLDQILARVAAENIDIPKWVEGLKVDRDYLRKVDACWAMFKLRQVGRDKPK